LEQQLRFAVQWPGIPEPIPGSAPPTAGVAVAAASEPVARLFRATGLTKIVLMFATCQEAVSFLQVRVGGK
jgi:hypothetical protein